MPQILGDDIPLLSPALGFQHDVALVTVSVTERTKGNRLNTQPYLVSSTRELVRFSDIQRYLKGETVEPGAVFRTVHDLFTRYVDFRSEVESAILALWTIGTYFYTMFPAYPYMALNGPKNSGKSTVMRVMQPLAFNMVSTSDPTSRAYFG